MGRVLSLEVEVDWRSLFGSTDLRCACEDNLNPVLPAHVSLIRLRVDPKVEIWLPFRGGGKKTLSLTRCRSCRQGVIGDTIVHRDRDLVRKVLVVLVVGQQVRNNGVAARDFKDVGRFGGRNCIDSNTEIVLLARLVNSKILFVTIVCEDEAWLGRWTSVPWLFTLKQARPLLVLPVFINLNPG